MEHGEEAVSESGTLVCCVVYPARKRQLGRNKTPHLPPPVPTWVGSLELGGPGPHRDACDAEGRRAQPQHAGVLRALNQTVGGARQGKQGPTISIWEAKMRYFLGKIQRRLRLLFRLPLCGFSLRKAEPSFGRCTLPPTNRQNTVSTFTSTSASRLMLSSLPPAAARCPLPAARCPLPSNTTKASSLLGKAVGAARHEAALFIAKY